MNKSILPAISFLMIIPMTACASNLFRKSAKTEPRTEVAAVQPEVVADGTQLAGEWVITEVGDTKIDREENYPYVHFVPAENSFYASNGCNVLNGIFTLEGSDRITFHNVLSTMRYCADTPFDTSINAVLADENTLRYVTDTKNGEKLLYLEDKEGKRLMTLHRPGLDFINGNWTVTEIDGKATDTEDVTIFFDIDERRVHGNTGCNSFNGDIFVDPQNPGKLSLTNMAVTMRMCPNIALQSSFLIALEQSVGAKAHGKNTVYLTDAEGKKLIKLERRG